MGNLVHINKFDSIIWLFGISVVLHFIFLPLHLPIPILFGPLVFRAHSYHLGADGPKGILEIAFGMTVVLFLFRFYLYFMGIQPGGSLFTFYYFTTIILMGLTLLGCPLRMIFFYQKRHHENSKRTILLNQLASLCILAGLTCIFLFFEILYDWQLEIPINNIYYVFLIVGFVLVSIYLWGARRDPVAEVSIPLLSSSSHSVEEESLIEQKLAIAMTEDKLYSKVDFSLDMLANHTGIAKYRLSEHFRDYHDKTFYEYVAEYRIKQAIQTMGNDNFAHTIEALAHSLGFNSVTTFNKYFKENVGCSPSEYREKNTVK